MKNVPTRNKINKACFPQSFLFSFYISLNFFLIITVVEATDMYGGFVMTIFSNGEE